MRLYHGTNAEIQRINLNMSRVGNDIGNGLYPFFELIKKILLFYTKSVYLQFLSDSRKDVNLLKKNKISNK